MSKFDWRKKITRAKVFRNFHRNSDFQDYWYNPRKKSSLNEMIETLNLLQSNMECYLSQKCCVSYFLPNSVSPITVQKNLWKIITSSFESICNGFSWMKIDYNGRKFSDLFRYENDFDITIIHFFVKTKSMETHY